MTQAYPSYRSNWLFVILLLASTALFTACEDDDDLADRNKSNITINANSELSLTWKQSGVRAGGTSDWNNPNLNLFLLSVDDRDLCRYDADDSTTVATSTVASSSQTGSFEFITLSSLPDGEHYVYANLRSFTGTTRNPAPYNWQFAVSESGGQASFTATGVFESDNLTTGQCVPYVPLLIRLTKNGNSLTITRL